MRNETQRFSKIRKFYNGMTADDVRDNVQLCCDADLYSIGEIVYDIKSDEWFRVVKK